MNSQYLIAGNWKMNPVTLDEAKVIVQKTKAISARLENTSVIACPPFVFISTVMPKNQSDNFSIGAQSCSTNKDNGAHTSEISALMLKSLGVTHVIVGHSEQRQKGDSDETVSKRLRNVLEAEMTAIVCVGEKSRDAEGLYLNDLKNQIKNSLADIPKKYTKNIVMAYEPVWAIGAVEAMKPADVYETSLFVKKVFADVFTPEVGVKTKVLYGGAVNSENASEIIKIGQVDGLLVGRESVNVEGFAKLLKAVDIV